MKEEEKECEALLRFLKLTKEGKYAIIEETSIPYTRMKEQTIDVENEIFYYGLG